ncbi:MAG: nucleotidyltransferase family protein [Spirochaetota bacterium]
MELPQADRDMIHQLAMGMNERNRRQRAKRALQLAERVDEAHREVGRLVAEFRRIDPELERVVLFGSLARSSVTRLSFDIDLAVSTRRYLELLGPALASPFKVDLVDLDTAAPYVLEAIARDGVEKYRAGT